MIKLKIYILFYLIYDKMKSEFLSQLSIYNSKIKNNKKIISEFDDNFLLKCKDIIQFAWSG